MLTVVRNFWALIWARKRFWLLPIFVMTAFFGALILLSQGSTVSPFIYTIF